MHIFLVSLGELLPSLGFEMWTENSRTIRETPRQRDGIPSYLDRYYPDPGIEIFMELETVTS